MKDNKVKVEDFFGLLLSENYSSLDDYFNSISLDKKELSNFKAKKKSKEKINQQEEDIAQNKKDKEKSLRKNKPDNVSNFVNDKKSGEKDKEEKSPETVPPDFSEEEKKDYSKVDLKEANIFREVVKLIGRMRAGYSIEEDYIEEKFKFYFTQVAKAMANVYQVSYAAS